MFMATRRSSRTLSLLLCFFHISFLVQAAEPLQLNSNIQPSTSASSAAASTIQPPNDPSVDFFSNSQALSAAVVAPPVADALILVGKDFGTWSSTVNWVDVKTLDLDGDGKSDVVGRNQATGQWVAGISKGSHFEIKTFGTWSTAVQWLDVRAGDVDGDGKDDIIGRTNGGQWWAAVSTGTGFTNKYMGAWSTALTWVDVFFTDLDNDGKDDVVGRAKENGQWWVGKSNGTTLTNQLWTTWAYGPGFTWVDVQFGNVDGLGNIDLIGRHKESGQWWAGISNGTSFANKAWGFWDPSKTWVDVLVGDFNGDGKADMIGRLQQNGQWWAGMSTGTTFNNQLLTGWSPLPWADVRVGDLNGDGKSDIIARASGEWWAGISNGFTMETKKLAVWATNVTWKDVQLGDVDGDGLLDLMGRSSATGIWQAGIERAVPTTPSIVTTKPNDRRLYVQDRLPSGNLTPETAFVSRGVNWSPHSRGVLEANLHLEFAKAYETDIPLMAQMGINTVRVYHDFGIGPQAKAILDKFYHYGIKVIMQVDSPTFEKKADMENLKKVVAAYKNHPAILMWAVGNEWDINNYYETFSTLAASIAFTEEAAKEIKKLDPTRAVTSVLGDIASRPLSRQEFIYPSPAVTTKDIIDAIPSVDVWGVNIFRRNSLGSVFSEWRSISNKPMYIGEYGTDSYNHAISGSDQSLQSTHAAKIWDEVFYDLSAERTVGTAVGALAFEWNDEWWKNGNPSGQAFSNEIHNGHPDGYNDEEYFGLLTIDRTPKLAYTTLKNRNTLGQSATSLTQAPVIKVTSSSNAKIEIDDRTIFDRAGEGARGFTVAIIDPNTGIRASEVKHFDTWGDAAFARNTFQVHGQLADYLASIPNGAIYVIMVADDAGLIHSSGNPFGNTHVNRIYAELEALGSTKIRSVPYQGRWAMIGVKGGGVLAEQNGTGTLTVQSKPTLTLNPNAGRR